MTGVQRIQDYGQMKKEAPEYNLYPLLPEWPQEGSIEFNQVSLTYTANGLPSLKNVSFKVNSREKVDKLYFLIHHHKLMFCHLVSDPYM